MFFHNHQVYKINRFIFVSYFNYKLKIHTLNYQKNGRKATE